MRQGFLALVDNYVREKNIRDDIVIQEVPLRLDSLLARRERVVSCNRGKTRDQRTHACKSTARQTGLESAGTHLPALPAHMDAILFRAKHRIELALRLHIVRRMQSLQYFTHGSHFDLGLSLPVLAIFVHCCV